MPAPPPRSRRPHGRRLLAVVVAAGLAVAATACGGGDEGGTPVLKWYARDEAGGIFGAAIEDCNAAAEGRYRIELQALPSNADEQREQLVRRLAAGDSDIDLMNMDVIWTAEFANAEWILPWPEDQVEEATEGRLDIAVESATYEDTLYGIPLNTNAQLLWYRTDLTEEPPATWDEMLAAADELEQEGKPHVIWEQGQRYEGLVVWFASLLASAGGAILNEEGTEVSLDDGPTRRALEVLSEFARSSHAPPALATAQEDQGRQGWESGSAAFMVNYGFVWPSANELAPDIAEKMAWAPFPSVEPDVDSTVVAGGFNIGIGAYGDHPDLAVEAATCLANEENQTRNAQDAGLLPVTEALYDDPEVTEAENDAGIKLFPYAAEMKEALDRATLRPRTPFYNDVSLAIISILHPASDIDPEADVDRLREAIEQALEGEGLL
ncbi:ABC transporter substrate-binding protein [Iamia sp. SCSIO 61187]|uniref:ABC transporter substrate-binding protein n=1 Tax=Iamia sp. SCSIO 61187 TaxID=2722752 RepID=UPI001C634A6B|nr:ABC transporter substrate-binding protein [Iamia sp. SCSIO 61187]QYG92811.1 ABC transporter substrate-binding protein [Iamia sp. SCSIO 61187]